MTSRIQRIVILALTSRLLTLFLMVVADAALPDLDSSSHLQNFPCFDANNSKNPVETTPSFMDRFMPWDSVYFIRIAKCGYEFDMTNAFFPLLPFIMRYGGMVIPPIQGVAIDSIYAIIGLIVNLIAFCVAAVALDVITRTVLVPTATAVTDKTNTLYTTVQNITIVLFCCNPASVFYSAVYTESLFAAFTWSGIALLLRDRYWYGVALLTAASATRSNGILGAWFIIHRFLLSLFNGNSVRGESHYNTRSSSSSSHLMYRNNSLTIIRNGIKMGVACCFIWSPYVAMQWYGYDTYCRGVAETPSWCSNKSIFFLPSLYAYVQDAYWDVGFLRFYKHVNRWPWFIQSSPVLLLSFFACWTWARHDWRRCLTLGITVGTTHRKVIIKDETSASSFGSILGLSTYIYQLAGMTAIATLVMHVNVATRFLSSCPALYWYASWIAATNERGARWIWLWAWVSAILGCIMFPNFYPWT